MSGNNLVRFSSLSPVGFYLSYPKMIFQWERNETHATEQEKRNEKCRICQFKGDIKSIMLPIKFYTYFVDKSDNQINFIKNRLTYF